MLPNILRHSSDIHAIQRGIHFIQHEKRTGLVAMDRKQQRQRRNRLLATGQVLHVAEPFERRHGVIFEAGEVWLGRVFHVEVGLAAEGELGGFGQILVGPADVLGDVREGFHEQVVPLLLDVFEGAFGGRRALARVGEVRVDGGEARFGCGEAFACAHVGGGFVDVSFETGDLVREFELGFF
jgi:hypothetical protein